MKNWAKLFRTYRGASVYAGVQGQDISEIERAAVSAGLAFFKVDLSQAATKEDFLRAVSEALSFPAYFGMNWDALEECLTDFEWHAGKGYVIVLQAADTFSRTAPDEFKTASSILKSAAKFWKTREKPFYVILI